MSRKPSPRVFLGQPWITSVALALLIAVSLCAGEAGSSNRETDSLQLSGRFAVTWDQAVECPTGTNPTLACFTFIGKGVIPGLGRATVTYTKTFNRDFERPCVRTLPNAVVAVAGKGRFELALVGPTCEGLPPARSVFTGRVTGGSGAYAGAAGTSRIVSKVTEPSRGVGIATDAWDGALTVPGFVFDRAAPVLSGATTRRVLAPKGAKQVRVGFAVRARDAVDGQLAVTCTHKPGSRFPVGSSKVTCTATDTSGNTGRARLTIVVR